MPMVQTATRSVVDHYASMLPGEFADSVTPKLWIAECFVADAGATIERGQLLSETPAAPPPRTQG